MGLEALAFLSLPDDDSRLSGVLGMKRYLRSAWRSANSFACCALEVLLFLGLRIDFLHCSKNRESICYSGILLYVEVGFESLRRG